MFGFKAQMQPDEEFQKQIKEYVLGIARNVSRELITDVMRAEIKRIAEALAEPYQRSWGNALRDAVGAALKGVLQDNWTEITKKLDGIIAEKAEKVLLERLKAKLLDEIGGAREEIRRMIREEIRLTLQKI